MLKVGSKVTYVSFSKNEIGIIKSFSEDRTHAFVVYNCGELWEHYKEYTATSTNIKSLIEGWYKHNYD